MAQLVRNLKLIRYSWIIRVKKFAHVVFSVRVLPIIYIFEEIVFLKQNVLYF